MEENNSKSAMGTQIIEQSVTVKADEADENTEKKKGLALLIHDLKQPKLIPIKLLSLIVFSGWGVLGPFVAIHMKSLGISVEETGIIYGISSVVSVLTPVGLGLIADKLGNFKVLLSVSFGLSGIIALLFLLIPVGRISVNYPTNMSMALGCFDDHSTEYSFASLTLTDLDLHPCKFKLDGDSENSFLNVSAVLDECGTMCYRSEQLHEGIDDRVNSVDTFSSSTKIQEFRDAVFFPNNWNLNVTCSEANALNKEVVCTLNRYDNSMEQTTQANKMLRLDLTSQYTSKTTRKFRVNWMTADDGTKVAQKSSSFQCGSYEEKQDLRYTVNSQDNRAENSRKFYQICLSQCIIRMNRTDLCSNPVREEIFNPQLTFWLYLILYFIHTVFGSGSAILFEGASLVLVNEVHGDFGFQKVFGFIGLALFPPISGVLIDYFSTDSSIHENIRPAFYLYAVFFGVATIGMLTIDLNFKPPAKNLIKDVKSLLKNFELDLLFFMAFASGIFAGYGGFCLFLFLEEIGGSKSLMGLSITFQSVAVIPLLIFSDRIFRKMSHPNVQVICFGVNFIRLIGYSYLQDPLLCLLLESLEAITWNFARISHVSYANELGTKLTVASIQGLLSAITFGLGCGVGSFGGSLLIGVYGLRVTFRILGVTSFISGLLYFLLNIFYLRRKNNDKPKSSNKVDQNGNDTDRC